jgi:uncharacterized protein (DUF1778 family)
MTYIWHMNDARLTVRLSTEVKHRIERGARAAGFSSVSDFMVSSALRAAEESLLRSTQLLVSEQAFKTLLAAQNDNAPEASPELQAALAKYEEFVLRHG